MIGTQPPTIVVATTAERALAARSAGPACTVVAGGTDVMVAVNAGRSTPAGWLSIGRVAEWSTIDRIGDRLRIGAAVTLARLEASTDPVLPGVLGAAIRTIGSPQVRAAATLAGNVVTASPAGDTLPALLCLDAELELASVRGVRRLSLDAFLLGPKRTALADDELLTAITVDATSDRCSFAKHATRRTMAISLCSLAVAHRAGSWRVAIGAVAPTARRVLPAEHALKDGGDAATFADAVVAAAEPVDDHRGSAAHRRHALGVLARRAHHSLTGASG